MEITEVRIKLMAEGNDKLRAFCSITIDNDFVVRDLKVIEGSRGPFVAMPSRKLTERCPRCKAKNHYRAYYCNDCGNRLSHRNAGGGPRGNLRDRDSHEAAGHDTSHDPARSSHDSARSVRVKLHADIAHPINSRCRELIQARILEEYYAEIERSKDPNYHPVDFDVFDEDSLAEEAGEMVSAGSPDSLPSESASAAGGDGGTDLETMEAGAEAGGAWSAEGSSHRSSHDSAPGAHDPARSSHDPARGFHDRRPHAPGRGHGPGRPRHPDSRPSRFSRGPGDRDRPHDRRDGGRDHRGRSSHHSAPGSHHSAPGSHHSAPGSHHPAPGSHHSARSSHDPTAGSHDRFRGFRDSGQSSRGPARGGFHDAAGGFRDPVRDEQPRGPREDLELLHEGAPEPKKPAKDVEAESEDNFGVGLFS